MAPVGHTAGTDRALLESNPSSPEGAIGSQNGNRAPGKARFPWSHSPRFDKLRGLGQSPYALVGEWRLCLQYPDENKQLFHRLPLEVVENTLAAFNDGHLSQSDACVRLGVGRSRLYNLRTVWMTGGRHLSLGTSGGDPAALWPDEADAFLRITLATGEPANFSFLADELFRRFAFKHSASNVRGHIRKHMPELLHEPLKRGPKPRRRWQREGYGDLLQHDSSPRPC